MRAPHSSSLSFVLSSILVASLGCAGVKSGSGGGGGGGGTSGITGSGGTVVTMPSIPGLTGLSVAPGSATISLSQGAVPGSLSGSSQFAATGTFTDGSSSDVSSKVNWTVQPVAGLRSSLDGTITVTAPGTYKITATSGSISSNTVTLVASFSGSFVCSDLDSAAVCTARGAFNTSAEGTLDGSPSGSTTIAYPLSNSLFPSNLGPIQVQLTTAGTAARVNFSTASGNLNVNYYGACESGPGTGCSISIPLKLTQLLVPSSATEDIRLTARVSANGAPMESAPITANWAQSSLTGGLYYWTVLPNQKTCGTPTPGTYCLLDTSQSPPNGTAIYRYDFSADNPAPQLVWTDDGGPNSVPAYQGAPQAWDNGNAGGHCIGCHTITNDGRFMALTIGGSSTFNAANWELLDIASQSLDLINPAKTGGNGCNDPNATWMNDPTCYWETYRKDAFATETAWGPNGDVMVSMYAAKLYFNTVAVAATGNTATITKVGLAFPTSSPDPYQSDPFWSHDGSLLAFTSFSQAATATSGNPNGLNGDLKTGGRIAIAGATQQAVMDNAKVLVTANSTVSNYYPCISEDSKFVVFNQSTCGAAQDFNAGSYGDGTCDGYDDSSAKLWWVGSGGGATIRLDNANGGNSNNYDNSWPRFSPDVGTFRGGTLYWVAFSSRRPYGIQLNNTTSLATTQPQLWFAGVVVQEVGVGDPSFAPVWLPGQNPSQAAPNGNHVPQWVRTAVTIN